MELITTKQAAAMVADITQRRIQQACRKDQIPGAVRPGQEWLLDKEQFLTWHASRPGPGQPRKVKSS